MFNMTQNTYKQLSFSSWKRKMAKSKWQAPKRGVTKLCFRLSGWSEGQKPFPITSLCLHKIADLFSFLNENM